MGSQMRRLLAGARVSVIGEMTIYPLRQTVFPNPGEFATVMREPDYRAARCCHRSQGGFGPKRAASKSMKLRNLADGWRALRVHRVDAEIGHLILGQDWHQAI
jgi:hypothetical protein